MDAVDVGAGELAATPELPPGPAPGDPTPRGRRATGGQPPPVRSRRRTVGVLALALAAYLVLAVVLWWGAWSTHPSTVTTCDCGDTSLFLWFLDWPAYALAHGHDLFYSTALFHPGGIDLLSNTSVLAVGVPLAPVTWIWGPVATLNVASTLAPALSALAMCWLLLRWVRWAPAAVVGGLVFGFSPFVVTSLAGAHLMSGVLVLLPLMAACLDELLVRQRRRPLAVGALLGLLVSLQFFVGTEVLAMAVVLGAVGVLLVVAYAAVGHRAELRAHAGHAALGLAATAVVMVVLLAYPVWVALAGPAHLSGLVWPTITPGSGGITLHGLWRVDHLTTLRHQMLATGGYQGSALLTTNYVGAGSLVVAVGGLLAWRRDRRLWCFGAVGLVAVVLALGRQSYWTPWRVLARVPVLQNVVPGRIMAVVTLCLAVMVGVVVDRSHAAVRRVLDGAWRNRGRPLPAALAALAGLAVAALAFGPMAGAVAPNVPLTTVAATQPAWFAEVGAHLPPGQVVLAYPAPFALEQSAEGWQALDGLDWSLVGGSGPEGVLSRAGPERTGQAVVASLSFSLTGPPRPTAANVDAVRRALAGWGVTWIVVPGPGSAPRYARGTDPAAATAFFTLAVGRPPTYRDGAWVWSDVTSPAPARTLAAGALARCTTTAHWRQRTGGDTVPACTMAASRPA